MVLLRLYSTFVEETLRPFEQSLFVFVVLGMVKRASELRSGVLTQCLKIKTVDLASGVRMSTIHNILLKINTKLRGINHQIPVAIRFVLLEL